MGTLMRNLLAPATKLRIQVVDIRKRPRGKERIAEVLNLALDFSLFIAPAGGTGPWRKVIVPGELEQPWMKPNGTALAFQDRTPQIVVHERPGHPGKQAMKGVDVPAQKTLQRLIEREEGRQGTRVRKDHHEARERSRAVADPDHPKGAPVNLGFFRW